MVAQITFLTLLSVVIGTKSPSGGVPVITRTRVYDAPLGNCTVRCIGNGHLAEASQARRAVLGLVLHAHIAADRVAIRARALRAGFAEHTPVWRNTLAQAVRTLFDRTAKQ